MVKRGLVAVTLSIAILSSVGTGQEEPGQKDEAPVVWVYDGTKGTHRRENRLLDGEYERALDTVSDLRKRLDSIEDPKEANLLLDEMSRVIIEARRALWERERGKKKGKEGERKSSLHGLNYNAD